MFRIIQLCIISLCFCGYVSSISQYPVVVVISYDGFRYNYYDKGVTPFLESLRSKGTYAEYMNNMFITETYPNHNSIATGTYPETHGVVGNSCYDPVYGKEIGYSYELWHYSDQVLPIWILNEIKGEGRHSGIMMWPGGDYNYTGINPTHRRVYDNKVKYEDRIDEVIEWILDPEKPANLVFLYIEEPDGKGHEFGPESDEVAEQLAVMDSTTKYLMNKLAENNLTNVVNLFFLSDHGMQSVTRDHIIDLREFVSDDLYDWYDGTPNFLINPKAGAELEVYNALKAASDDGIPFKVYQNSEIPERWHWKNNRRAPPILATADIGYAFHDHSADDDEPFGVHGYDNNELNMKPHFLALGPQIKENHKIEPFENIDLFSLWAEISGFPEYALSTNGSFDRVSEMLK